MLAISRDSTKPSERVQCTPNILPCRVHHDGPVKATKRHWDPEDDEDGSRTAYFRGRKLRGKRVDVPEDYLGVILKKTERVVQSPESKLDKLDERRDDEDPEAEEDADEPPEEAVAMDEAATFDSFTVWGHEALPDQKDNLFIRGVSEWVKFAEAMHSYEPQSRAGAADQKT